MTHWAIHARKISSNNYFINHLNINFMNKNKTFKRFLKLMGFKMEDVLSTEDIISVVAAQVKTNNLKLDDVLTVFDAKNISRSDLTAFVQRVATQNAWNLETMFGAREFSLDEAAKDISKDALKEFVLRTAKKNNWDVNTLLGFVTAPQTVVAPKVMSKSNFSKPLQIFDDAESKMSFAKCENETIGVLINSPKVGSFILALKDYAQNLDFEQTTAKIANLPAVNGKKWIVPSDEHFRALSGKFRQLNDLLDRLNGNVIYTRGAYLSSTSQANKPSSWHVRLVLPLD